MKSFLHILIILLLPMYVGGQNIILKGKVIDGKTNKPIEYAHIRLKNSSIGTITNTLGIFSIALPAEISKDEKISVSMLGYKTVEQSIGQIITDSCIRMEPNAKLLDPVKIVAYNTAEGVVKECIRRMESNYYVSSGYYNCRMVQSHSETRCNSKARLWKGV